jgi:tetratricopeptide (TPR) repeat protein
MVRRRISKWLAGVGVAALCWGVTMNSANAQQPVALENPDLAAQAEAPPAEGPPSEALANALRLYQQERYQEASVQFQRVVEGETQDAPANQQKAQFHLGKSLYHLGFYQSALAVFDEIVERGQAHLYFRATLQWLAQLASQLPEPADIVRRVGRYPTEDLNQFNNAESRNLYNQLLYLMGRSKYRDGNYDESIALFRQVQRTSRYYVQSKFFEGISHVNAHRSQPAVDAFREVLRAIEEGVEGVEDEDRMADLAWLELARMSSRSSTTATRRCARSSSASCSSTRTTRASSASSATCARGRGTSRTACGPWSRAPSATAPCCATSST